jgi:hypothetical protein
MADNLHARCNCRSVHRARQYSDEVLDIKPVYLLLDSFEGNERLTAVVQFTGTSDGRQPALPVAPSKVSIEGEVSGRKTVFGFGIHRGAPCAAKREILLSGRELRSYLKRIECLHLNLLWS